MPRLTDEQAYDRYLFWIDRAGDLRNTISDISEKLQRFVLFFPADRQESLIMEKEAKYLCGMKSLLQRELLVVKDRIVKWENDKRCIRYKWTVKPKGEIDKIDKRVKLQKTWKG